MPSHSKYPWLLSAVILAAVLIAYIPAINGGFIWDDDDYVTENPVLRDMAGLGRIWTERSSLPQWYPLVHTTFWIEFQVSGLRPLLYHVDNLILHGLASVLLLLLLRRLGMRAAFPAALVFALHPVHVESVAWITERKNVLSALLFFASLLTWLRWRPLGSHPENRRGGRGFYWLSLGLFLAALLSKTVTCSQPAVMLILLWWREGKIRRRDLMATLPFFALGLLLALMTAADERNHVMAQGAAWEYSIIERCLIAGRALWFYIGKLLMPVGLAFNYPHYSIATGSFMSYVYPGAFVVLLGCAVSFRRRIGRGPIAALLIFSGMLVPALGFINVFPMRYTFVADHYQYLASLGVIILLCEVFETLRARQDPGRRQALAALGLIMLTGLAIQTWQQARIYENRETLWADTLEKEPRSWIACGNLGRLKLDTGRTEEAEVLLRRGLELNPVFPEARNNLGVALYKRGQVSDAIACFQRAMKENPMLPNPVSNLGYALWKRGDEETASGLFKAALAIAPHHMDANHNLAQLLAARGQHGEAVPHFEEALSRMPNHLGFRVQLGRSLAALGKHEKALSHLLLVVKRNPALDHVRILSARSLLALGNARTAMALIVQELSSQPQSTVALQMLVDLLLVHSGQEDAAALIRRVEAACATIPRSLCDILVLLGEKLRQEGRSVPGTELIRRAIILARNTGRTEDAAAWEATLSTRR